MLLQMAVDEGWISDRGFSTPEGTNAGEDDAADLGKDLDATKAS